jgi:hypothetical protein
MNSEITPNSEINSEKYKDDKKESLAFACSELAFIVLPFIVMIITFIYKNSFYQIFKHPEWSIASSIMFGQCVTKTIYILGKKNVRNEFQQYRIGAILSLIIIFGLVPSLTLLSLIFATEIVPMWMIISQIILFILAALVYFLFNFLHVFFEKDENYTYH